MAADMQEPPELLIAFFQALANDECDVAIGTRSGREDPLFSRLASEFSGAFTGVLVVQDMPAGGVDIFGCNRQFRDQLLQLEESRSSLIALIFWLGFRRKFVNYKRKERQQGKSAWTLRKKIDYMMDSIFAFTDYPIRLLITNWSNWLSSCHCLWIYHYSWPFGWNYQCTRLCRNDTCRFVTWRFKSLWAWIDWNLRLAWL